MSTTSPSPLPNWLSWKAHLVRLAEQAGVETLDASQPEPTFRYPPFPDTRLTGDDIEREARRRASPKFPANVRWSRSLGEALTSWIDERELGGARVGLITPHPPEFAEALASRRLSCDAVSLDPDTLDELPVERWQGLILSHPNRIDGSYMPQDPFDAWLDRLRERAPDLPILIDTSTALFTLNEVPPGRRDPAPKLDHLQSLRPVMSPQGGTTAWWIGADEAPARDPLPEDALKECVAVLSAFDSRQGRAFLEFQNKILLLEKGLRHWGDVMKPAFLSASLKVTLWPESGFSLVIDGTGLARRRQVANVAELLAQEGGLITLPGPLCGLPGTHFALCFAGTPMWLNGLGERLVKVSEKVL